MSDSKPAYDKEYHDAYREKHRERILERERKRLAERSEEERQRKIQYNRDYYARNKDRFREYQQRTKDERNARQRERYATCPEYREKAKASAKITSDVRRAHRNRRQYGLTPTDYELLLDLGCAICGAKPDMGFPVKFHVDHNHRTGKTRGILCQSCNLAILHSGIFTITPSLPLEWPTI